MQDGLFTLSDCRFHPMLRPLLNKFMYFPHRRIKVLEYKLYKVAGADGGHYWYAGVRPLKRHV